MLNILDPDYINGSSYTTYRPDDQLLDVDVNGILFDSISAIANHMDTPQISTVDKIIQYAKYYLTFGSCKSEYIASVKLKDAANQYIQIKDIDGDNELYVFNNFHITDVADFLKFPQISTVNKIIQYAKYYLTFGFCKSEYIASVKLKNAAKEYVKIQDTNRQDLNQDSQLLLSSGDESYSFY
ncbi:MAG: hypothetical protein WD595_06920 [Waddliaceae bacterium]